MGIQQIKCGNVNCYLITEGNHSILVDTGRVAYKEKILKFCKGANVQLIVLTHGHVNHIQNGAQKSCMSLLLCTSQILS